MWSNNPATMSGRLNPKSCFGPFWPTLRLSQRIVDVAAANAPGVTGTASPAAPASAVAAARNAAAGGPWRRPRRAGDRRRVDANRRLDAATVDRRSGCPGRLDAATMDRRSGCPAGRTPGPSGDGWLPDRRVDRSPRSCWWAPSLAGTSTRADRRPASPRSHLRSRLRSTLRSRRPTRSTSRKTSTGVRPTSTTASTCASGTVSTSTIRPPTIEHFKTVPCTKEHDFELFYVGAMGKRSHPTTRRNLGLHEVDYCDPAFGPYIGKDVDDSELDYYWLVPTEDAWRSGDRTVQCAA